jgi:hypothetical protein
MIKNISTFFPLNKPYIKLLSFVLLLSVWAISAQSAFANEGNGKGVIGTKRAKSRRQPVVYLSAFMD